MILEFSERNYVDMEKVQSLRWFEEQGAGVVVLAGDKIVVRNREHFDVIEQAYIYLHKSTMYNDEMKKIKYVKRES